MSNRPRVLLFTGDGKGKTTAALGMAFRASGHGMPVCVVQFVKCDPDVGEVAAAARWPGVEIVQTGAGFVPQAGDPRWTEHRAAALAGLEMVRGLLAARRHSMIVLDEVCVAVSRGLLDEADLVELVRQAPPDVCLVLTGRDATAALVDLADTVTEARCVKHAYRSGVPAQKGVEL